MAPYPVSWHGEEPILACRNDVASATAVWHQVKEEVMEIHSKLERRTQLDKQAWPRHHSHCVTSVSSGPTKLCIEVSS